jgi:hypothetical protein
MEIDENNGKQERMTPLTHSKKRKHMKTLKSCLYDILKAY